MRLWTISTHVTGRRRDVELRLYDDLAHMRRAATAWASRKHAASDFREAAAVAHGFQRLTYANGVEVEKPLVAIIRLARSHVTPKIVSHEVAHAAQHIYGLDYDDGEPVINHMHSGNEDFAYLYGELFAAAWTCVRALDSTL